MVGNAVGFRLVIVGETDGDKDGLEVASVGEFEGAKVGENVGALVGVVIIHGATLSEQLNPAFVIFSVQHKYSLSNPEMLSQPSPPHVPHTVGQQTRSAFNPLSQYGSDSTVYIDSYTDIQMPRKIKMSAICMINLF